MTAEAEQQSVRVQWDDVATESKNGLLEGFHVRLVPEETALRQEFTKEELVRGAEARSTHFTRLRAFTAYRVFVSAFNLVGEGPHADASPLVTTLPSVPGPPEHCRFGKVTNNSLLLVWEPPAQPNGVLTNFVLRHWREDRGEENAVATVLPHNVFQYSAASLTPHSRYVFGVKAQSAQGVSEEVLLPVTTSARQARPPSPPAPQHAKAEAPAERAVWFGWPAPGPLAAGQAPVREVEVEFQRTNQQGWTRHKRTLGPGVNKVQLKK